MEGEGDTKLEKKGRSRDSSPKHKNESLELAEIELEEEKLALQKKELELRGRKLALLRERKGGGNIPIVSPQSYWRAYKQCNAFAFNNTLLNHTLAETKIKMLSPL